MKNLNKGVIISDRLTLIDKSIRVNEIARGTLFTSLTGIIQCTHIKYLESAVYKYIKKETYHTLLIDLTGTSGCDPNLKSMDLTLFCRQLLAFKMDLILCGLPDDNALNKLVLNCNEKVRKIKTLRNAVEEVYRRLGYITKNNS